MDRDRCRGLLVVGLIVLMLVVGGCGQADRRGVLYQVSTLQALMQGAYDGVVTFDDLRRHGDTGIGTLRGLDGEMILLDGRAWQARADGNVLAVPGGQTTPFATVAFLEPGQRVGVKGPVDLAGLGGALDGHLPTKNVFYMARIDGRFAYVKTRSVPAQRQPYPPLLEASKQQQVFERREVEGALVALRSPAFAKDINMAGWHMHFLAKDRTFGGHVLEVRLAGEATARVVPLRTFEMVLPSKGRFVEADLMKTQEGDIRKVEH